MKKWIILLAVAGLIAGVWWYLSTYVRVTPIWYQPKFGAASRGDIRVPITATGLIEPNERIEVKSKASGEVIDIPVKEGTYVRKGDVLLVLKKTDEQRKFDSANAELSREQALLAQAKISVDEAKASIVRSEAEIARLTAECTVSEYDLNKIESYRKSDPGTYAEQELVIARGRQDGNVALKRSAEAQLLVAQAAVPKAEQSIKLQEAAVVIAQTQLGDAQERLDETTIVAKQDALVTDVRVKISEVIQGGMNTFTGGTVVMYLADVSRKKVVARVDESDYGRVLRISPLNALPETPGLREAAAASAAEMEKRSGKVRLTVDAFPEEDFEGVIERVEPQGKLNQGAAIIQYNVHVAITDPKAHELPLGAQAQVEFTVESATNTLRVPAEAVKNYQGQRGVWLEVPPQRGSTEQWGKKFVTCRFGITDGEYTQVLEVVGEGPLKDGTKVYTKLPREPEKQEGE
jgi:HlyD family secretion protein